MRLLYPLLVLVLSACAGAPPQSATYLLRSATVSSSGPLAPSAIALDNVAVAAYLDQPGLVLARGDSKIQAARNFTWAEPLQVSLRRFLATEISAARSEMVSPVRSAQSSTHIDVLIDQLHGDGEGSAVLIAYWTVSGGSTESHHRFVQSKALSSDGYDALAGAEQALLGEFAIAIARSLPEPGSLPAQQQ